MQARTMLELGVLVGSLEKIATIIKEEAIDIIGSGDHIELIRHFDTLRKANELIKKARKALDDLEEHLSREDIPDAFKRIGIKTITIDDIGRVTVARQWHCSIVDGMKSEAFDWLKEGGNGGIIIETIPWQTLAAFAKHEVEEHGKELPTDLFTTTIRPYTSISKV